MTDEPTAAAIELERCRVHGTPFISLGICPFCDAEARPTASGDASDVIERVRERLSLHTTWRDSHGELNDAPNEAAALLATLSPKPVEGVIKRTRYRCEAVHNRPADQILADIAADIDETLASNEQPEGDT